jgi:nucleoside-diphosphate-sugar epimerase
MSFGLPVKIVRPFNTYGPRQSARAIIPAIISQIIDGRKKIEVGNITPTRDLTYVRDTASAFLEIMKCDNLIGEATNIGMNKEISIRELIELIAKIMDKEVEISVDEKRVRPEKSEVMRLRCDNSKLIKNTGWKPKYDLRKGLSETIEWMRENMGIYKPEIYNV